MKEAIESLKKTRDKLKKELDEFEQAIAELERLEKIAEATWNDPSRTREYQEAARKIPQQEMSAVGKVFVIGSDAIHEYNILGGDPQKAVVDMSEVLRVDKESESKAERSNYNDNENNNI